MNFRDRLEQSRERLGSNIDAILASEMDEGYTCEYFATDNIKSLPACLDLRMPSGNRKAVPYSLVAEINFDTENGIEITTNTKKIKITGRDLYKLYDFLVAYRVRYINAKVGADLEDEGLLVSEIIIEDLE